MGRFRKHTVMRISRTIAEWLTPMIRPNTARVSQANLVTGGIYNIYQGVNVSQTIFKIQGALVLCGTRPL